MAQRKKPTSLPACPQGINRVEEFVLALENQNIEKAKTLFRNKFQLAARFRRFNSEAYEEEAPESIEFIDIITKRPWTDQEKIYRYAPIFFFFLQDSNNDTVFHSLAKEKQSANLLQDIVNKFDGEKHRIIQIILKKNSGQRKKGTPLNIAIENSNYGFLDVVDSLLGAFAEALDTKDFLAARGILDKKLSISNQSQGYVTFLTVLNRKHWDEIESVINCCGPCNIIPLTFFLTQDTQNITIFHSLAKEPNSIGLMQNIFYQDQDLAIKKFIVTKTRSLPTPLEVAINKKNLKFIRLIDNELAEFYDGITSSGKEKKFKAFKTSLRHHFDDFGSDVRPRPFEIYLKEELGKYFLTILKRTKIPWEDLKKLYMSAPIQFLLQRDLEDDNMWHIFARKKSLEGVEKISNRLSLEQRKQLLTQKNYRNHSPFQAAMKNNPTNLLGAQFIYDYVAEYCTSDTFDILLEDDLTIIPSLPFHGIAKAAMSDDKAHGIEKRTRKYERLKKKLISIKRATLREHQKTLHRVLEWF